RFSASVTCFRWFTWCGRCGTGRSRARIRLAPAASSGRRRRHRRRKISPRRRSSPRPPTPIPCGRRRAPLPEIATGHAHPPTLAHHFDDLGQQREAATLGMWIFLGTEVLFFGGLFATYSTYRGLYPEAFAAASHEMVVWAGTLNTVVLITSSLTMALAVHAAQLGERKRVMMWLAVTMLLGAVFLGVKAFEYYTEFSEH